MRDDLTSVGESETAADSILLRCYRDSMTQFVS
jgi:hypothetical protein